MIRLKSVLTVLMVSALVCAGGCSPGSANDTEGDFNKSLYNDYDGGRMSLMPGDKIYINRGFNTSVVIYNIKSGDTKSVDFGNGDPVYEVVSEGDYVVYGKNASGNLAIYKIGDELTVDMSGSESISK